MEERMVRTEAALEVWRNVAAGMRWYLAFDIQGREVTKLAQPSRTFSLTTMERQINQERAATGELDLFRNGDFVLVKASGETNDEEIRSTDSFTDEEISRLAYEILADPANVERVNEINSPTTLQRILEELIVIDAPASVVNTVQAKVDSIKKPVPEVELVSMAPQPGTARTRPVAGATATRIGG
jgi:hypothetical protein